ncbi:hypothetical protein CMV_019943 [Castanea mollissima]|uniref:Uncharacterized protein n=1 Tax=Castanea mollissima TaxID=60419 RepID=A0A8J4QRG4_9ROSI|nr:hypothetical protein CMV_019943 [Castanea mollissima]
MEAIEGMRVALGAAIVLNYCLQGLFHPARKVREVYWKIYNSLYIGAQDALVAAYPTLEDEQNNAIYFSWLMLDTQCIFVDIGLGFHVVNMV